ncbi:MAG TPA: diacylglycerol kinase family protein [Terriglobales bacterium]|nr:diacylglycerol kinase family protein [Terriglobales bacterium]
MMVASKHYTANPERSLIRPGVDVGRPIRIGFINNPQSGRNRRRNSMRKILAALAQYPEVEHYEVSGLQEMTAAASELLHHGAEVIAVNGGDGTAHAVLTALLRECSSDALPLLAVIPGGTTNTTANDLGTREHPTVAVPRLLEQAHAGRLDGVVERRSIIRVEIAADVPALYGTVFGAGAVYHGVKYCHEHIYTKGLRGELASGLTVAVFAYKVMRGETGILFPPLHVSGSVDGKELPQRELFGIVIATVRRIFLNLRPFWGTESGAMQFSMLGYRPENFSRALVEMLREKPGKYLLNERCFTSHNYDEIVLNLDSGFMLDGELYLPRPGTPLTLTSGYTAPFLRPLR